MVGQFGPSGCQIKSISIFGTNIHLLKILSKDIVFIIAIIIFYETPMYLLFLGPRWTQLNFHQFFRVMKIFPTHIVNWLPLFTAKKFHCQLATLPLLTDTIVTINIVIVFGLVSSDRGLFLNAYKCCLCRLCYCFKLAKVLQISLSYL